MEYTNAYSDRWRNSETHRWTTNFRNVPEDRRHTHNTPAMDRRYGNNYRLPRRFKNARNDNQRQTERDRPIANYGRHRHGNTSAEDASVKRRSNTVGRRWLLRSPPNQHASNSRITQSNIPMNKQSTTVRHMLRNASASRTYCPSTSERFTNMQTNDSARDSNSTTPRSRTLVQHQIVSSSAADIHPELNRVTSNSTNHSQPGTSIQHQLVLSTETNSSLLGSSSSSEGHEVQHQSVSSSVADESNTSFGQLAFNAALDSRSNSSVQLCPTPCTRSTSAISTPGTDQSNISISEINCAICIDTRAPSTFTSQCLVCRHHFHRECLEGWLGYKQHCPLCRTELQ